MSLMLQILAGISLLELLLWLAPLWRWRKFIALIVAVGLIFTSVGLVAQTHTIWNVLLLVLSVYRIINLLRVVRGRTQADYLYRVARQSSLLLILLQGLTQVVLLVGTFSSLSLLTWLYILAAGQVAAALILLSSTLRHLRTTTPPTIDTAFADRELPSLTVAIPARNETAELEACLKSLLTSDYPKLEILVLDDCSQNKRTPELIRSFAHDGVRFVAGDNPPDYWLPKNHAYAQLAAAASGDFLLFCGVDARFEPKTLRQMVATCLVKKKSMISFVPRNRQPGTTELEALLVQPGRYAWELALPRRWLNRPPVLSSCWLITTSMLKEAGGFQANAHSSSPESYFALQAANHQDGYSFLQSNDEIGLRSAKQFAEQQATAIRTRYPQTHRRPEIVCLLSIAELAVLVSPFSMLFAAAINRVWGIALVSGFAVLLLSIFYASIVRLTYRRFLLRGCWLLPFAALYDIGLLNYSMWQYEFSEVLWKGRNVCIPVMRVIERLPALP